MIKSESWSPIWCFKKRLYDTCQIYKTVTHQEEPVIKTLILDLGMDLQRRFVVAICKEIRLLFCKFFGYKNQLSEMGR